MQRGSASFSTRRCLTRLRRIRATASPNPVDERQPAPNADAATILVCDDDPSLRELVRAVLGPRYRFVEAADGTEALEIARELRPDLIVLDIMLPGLSGIEVLDVLRAEEGLRDTKVVVITAWSHAEIDAQVAGADRFVSKPFDPDDLSSAVEELLR
jgi:two-component system, cell cycle response regulator